MKQDFTRELNAAKEEAKKAAGPNDKVRVSHAQAAAEANRVKDELDKTQAFIDQQEAKGDKIDAVSQKHLDNMLKSRDTLQKQYDQHVIRKQTLEDIYPQLLEPAPGKEAEAPIGEQFGPPAPGPAVTPPPAAATASPAPVVNPNADNPVAAPPSGSTVTPTPTGAAPAAAAAIPPVAPVPTPGATPPPAKKRPSLDELSPYK